MLAGLLLTPIFHSMPPRMKFLGIHSWGLAACLSFACSWMANSLRIHSRTIIFAVSILVSLASLLMLSQWGYQELKQDTAQRTPLIPIPLIGSPEQLAESLQMQRVLAQAMVPTFTDYQRRRMNSRWLKRFRPLALWAGEMLIAAGVCIIVSRQVQLRQHLVENPASQEAMKPTMATHDPVNGLPDA